MLHFRTILLWLAFSLLILQNYITFNNLSIGLTFRLIPSGILLLWFLLSVFIKDRFTIDTSKTTRLKTWLIRILRPMASLSIVLGALLKIMHWPYGNAVLIAGIGFMAIYSTILGSVASRKDDYNPEIIDDNDDL